LSGTGRSPSAMNDPAGTTAATAGVESWDTPGTVTNGETTEWVDAHVVVIADCDTGETTIPPTVEGTLASTGTHGMALGGGIIPNPTPDPTALPAPSPDTPKPSVPPDSDVALDPDIPPVLELGPPGTLLDPTAPPGVHNKPQYHTLQLHH